MISFGFWAGDDNLGDAAFYSYTAPEPDGLREQPLIGGAWRDTGNGSLAILPYEAVRTAADPRATLLAFLQSAYEAGARTAGWDTSSFESMIRVSGWPLSVSATGQPVQLPRVARPAALTVPTVARG